MKIMFLLMSAYTYIFSIAMEGKFFNTFDWQNEEKKERRKNWNILAELVQFQQRVYE